MAVSIAIEAGTRPICPKCGFDMRFDVQRNGGSRPQPHMSIGMPKPPQVMPKYGQINLFTCKRCS